MPRLERLAAFILHRRHIPPQWRITREPPRGERCTECGGRIGRTQPAAAMPHGYMHLFKRDHAAGGRAA